MRNKIEKVIEAISRVVIYECSICGAFIGEREWKECEGVCSKHWNE